MDPRNVEPKWPLTHGERVVELQNVLQDPQKAIFHENIRAAIKYHQGFGQQELCSEQLIYFQNGRQVSEDERDGICWMESKISFHLPGIGGLRIVRLGTKEPGLSKDGNA